MEISCPTCGRSSNGIHFIGQFCRQCTIGKLRKHTDPNASVEICKFCWKIKNGLDYRHLNKESLGFAIRQSMKQKDCEIKVLSFDDEKSELMLTYNVNDEKVSFPMQIPVKRDYLMCPKCSRMKSGYYEALVQIRGDPHSSKRTLDALERFIKRREGFFSKVMEDENGYDVYISDKTATSAFFLKHRLKPKRSYTLSGMKKGKKLYRNIYSIKF
jgi:NMD protein affecting ribosome stability and mRNA decay